ncbi:MAG: hypothetical protein ACRED1_00430, partial [Limisphaerales bacterium]
AIPLTILDDLVIARADCFGAGKVLFCPDTGCQQCDAMLRAKWLRRLQGKEKLSWSTFFDGPGNRTVKVAGLLQGKIEGNTYHDLTVAQWDGAWPGGNLLGLPFLARNLVTFDFPERKLYLKQESPGPRNPALFAAEEAGKYLVELKNDGRLPGWATNDVGEGSAPDAPKCITNYPISLTFDFRKEIVPGWVDVTATVQSLLASGARDIMAGDALAGFDPAPNHPKDLRLLLRGQRHNRFVQTAQGRTLTLPPGADVIRAQYGLLSGPAFTPVRGNASFYHFVMVKKAPDDPWKLTRAWQSDVEGRLIKNYSAQ